MTAAPENRSRLQIVEALEERDHDRCRYSLPDVIDTAVLQAVVTDAKSGYRGRFRLECHRETVDDGGKIDLEETAFATGT